MRAPRKSYYEVLANQIKKKLEIRNFEVIICEDKEESKEKAFSMIKKDHSIGFGGSVTVEDVGIVEALYDDGFEIFDRNKEETLEDKEEMMRKSLTSDYFLTSFNGISKNGEVVNIDRRGNRVAAITYGPQYVYSFVGINKIYGNLDSTIEMVKNHTAPLNVQNLGDLKTPCRYTGVCADCQSEGSICCTVAVTRRSYEKGRIVIFLILEELGF